MLPDPPDHTPGRAVREFKFEMDSHLILRIMPTTKPEMLRHEDAIIGIVLFVPGYSGVTDTMGIIECHIRNALLDPILHAFSKTCAIFIGKISECLKDFVKIRPSIGARVCSRLQRISAELQGLKFLCIFNSIEDTRYFWITFTGSCLGYLCRCECDYELFFLILEIISFSLSFP